MKETKNIYLLKPLLNLITKVFWWTMRKRPTNTSHHQCYLQKVWSWINLWSSLETLGITKSTWESPSHFSSTARLCLHWASKESLLKWFTTLCGIRNLMQLGKIKFYVLQLKFTCGELHTNKCTAVSISDKAVKWRMKANAKKMFWFNCL